MCVRGGGGDGDGDGHARVHKGQVVEQCPSRGSHMQHMQQVKLPPVTSLQPLQVLFSLGCVTARAFMSTFAHMPACCILYAGT